MGAKSTTRAHYFASRNRPCIREWLSCNASHAAAREQLPQHPGRHRKRAAVPRCVRPARCNAPDNVGAASAPPPLARLPPRPPSPLPLPPACLVLRPALRGLDTRVRSNRMRLLEGLDTASVELAGWTRKAAEARDAGRRGGGGSDGHRPPRRVVTGDPIVPAGVCVGAFTFARRLPEKVESGARPRCLHARTRSDAPVWRETRQHDPLPRRLTFRYA